MVYIFIVTSIAAIIWAVTQMRAASSLRAENATLTERLRQMEAEAPRRQQADADRFRSLAAELMESN